ncbi:MAG: molybdopterin-dependent oxidoreductase [Smithellaceae bacterium]|jgi:formate dehydrogenase major subunit
MEKKVPLTIDGKNVEATAGQTILDCANENGIFIPTLCNHPALSPIGACRMCLVEIKGQRNLQTSCTFPVTDGMEIQTDSKAVIDARKLVLDMIFSERNHFCPYCEMSGNCELQDLGYRYRVDHWVFPTYTKAFPLDATHKYYLMEHNRCVLCERCIRACDELVANHTLGLRQRGSESMVHADGNIPLGESTCISCGTCTQVCPTGALFYKRSAFMGKDSVTKQVKSTCNQCSIGCGTEVVTRGGNVLCIMGDWDAPVNKGLLCKMGRFEPLYDTRPRLTKPLLRGKGKSEEISWEKAIQTLAKQINTIKAPEIGVLAGSYSSNEALYLIKKLFNQKLQVSNIGLINTVAPRIFNKVQSKLEDITKSDIILVVGSDPLNDQPVASFIIKRAVDKGARLIVVDDKKNGLAPFAFMNIEMADISTAIDVARRAENPFILYGADITKAAIAELKKLEDKVNYIIVESGVNTVAAAALGLNNGYDPAALKLVYVLLGEQNCAGDDLFKRIPQNAFIVAQASYLSELTEKADLVLPAAIWSEQSSSLTNIEGRIQSINKAVEPLGEAKPDWEALQLLSIQLGKDITVSIDEVSTEVIKSLK